MDEEGLYRSVDALVDAINDDVITIYNSKVHDGIIKQREYSDGPRKLTTTAVVNLAIGEYEDEPFTFYFTMSALLRQWIVNRCGALGTTERFQTETHIQDIVIFLLNHLRASRGGGFERMVQTVIK